MKKLIAIALALCMLLTITACGSNEAPDGSTPPANDNTPSSSATSGGINTDENLLTVDITLPASMFENEDMTSFNADSYAAEQGFTKAVLNSDGSVTVTMTKAKHNDLLSEMTTSIEGSFAELVGAADTPYIKEITHNEDFSAVTMKVGRAGYESAVFEITPLMIGMSAMMFQAFVDMEPICVITIVDVANGDTIKTVTYPVTE